MVPAVARPRPVTLHDGTYPPHPLYPRLEGMNDVATFARRSSLERGWNLVFVGGRKRTSRASRKDRTLAGRLARIRKKFGDRATRVVARTAADFLIELHRGLYLTQTGAGFGGYDSLAGLQARAFRYTFIERFALSWQEAVLAEDYMEAVVTQDAGTSGWRSLPKPRAAPDWAQRAIDAGLMDAGLAAVDAGEGAVPERDLSGYIRGLPPLPPEDPYAQVDAFLAEHCDMTAGADTSPTRIEVDFAVLQLTLEDWSLQRGLMPPSRQFVGRYLTEEGITKRASNGRTYYRGIRLKTPA